MGLFRKKSDANSERARALNEQIAALESQIQRLSDEKPGHAPPPAQPGSALRPALSAPPPVRTQPRLRSTARPHGATVLANPFTTDSRPVIEEADQQRLRSPAETASPEPQNDLGVRKSDLAAAWQRLKNHFSGPSTSNPKLVNYLAAGSVQGLRPLRYEKRVARNRFLLFLAGLILVLWGLLYIIFGHR